MKRPPVRTSSVAVAFATSTGFRSGRMYTMVAKRRRRVTAAIAATAANGSGQGVSGVKPGTPSGV